jgi:hypothetical protein
MIGMESGRRAVIFHTKPQFASFRVGKATDCLDQVMVG